MILNKIPSALLILGTSLCFATIGPSNVLDHNTEKDTGILYQDTSKNINQSISLHNNAAEPAKVITTTKIRRVPRYSYYNVYKTRTVWKCLPPVLPPKITYSWNTTTFSRNPMSFKYTLLRNEKLLPPHFSRGYGNYRLAMYADATTKYAISKKGGWSLRKKKRTIKKPWGNEYVVESVFIGPCGEKVTIDITKSYQKNTVCGTTVMSWSGNGAPNITIYAGKYTK